MAARTLQPADGLRLPLEFVTLASAILAKRGAGKSYLASVLAEEMLTLGQPIVALDPTGAWWGLKSSADGKAAGFPIAVFGGDHADVPLSTGDVSAVGAASGELIARAIVEHKFSAIIDLSEPRKSQARAFATGFLETLYRLNRDPLHVFIDEADLFAPQDVRGDAAPVVGAMEDLVRRGRKRGLGCTLITQRPAAINKNVLTQCEALWTLRMSHPRDVSAVMEWVELHADEKRAGEMIKSLPGLATGHAWAWAPLFDIFQLAHVRKRKTFDSGATPKVGEKPKAPKIVAPVDLDKLGAEIRQTVERARENDPGKLRAEIERLKRAAAAAPSPLPSPPPAPPVDIGPINCALADLETATGKASRELVFNLKLLTDAYAHGVKILRAAAEKIAREPRGGLVRDFDLKRSHEPPPRPAAARQQANGDGVEDTGAPEPGGRSGGVARVLAALAQFGPELPEKRLAAMAGISPRLSTWRTVKAALRRDGLADISGGQIRITQAGRLVAPAERIPTGAAAVDYWRGKLGAGAARQLFDALLSRNRAAGSAAHFEPAALGEAAGIDPSLSTFRTGLAALRKYGIVEGKRLALAPAFAETL